VGWDILDETIRAIHYVTLLQKVYPGCWFKKQKPEEKLAKHAAHNETKPKPWTKKICHW
jgi:hypothetical protein